jgi:hypothetical protein
MKTCAVCHRKLGLGGNPVAINIVFGTSTSVRGGQSQTEDFSNAYGTYTTLLRNNAASHPENQTLGTAIANLSHGNDGNGALPIFSTTAQLRALGQSIKGSFDNNGDFVGAQQGTEIYAQVSAKLAIRPKVAVPA